MSFELYLKTLTFISAVFLVYSINAQSVVVKKISPNFGNEIPNTLDKESKMFKKKFSKFFDTISFINKNKRISKAQRSIYFGKGKKSSKTIVLGNFPAYIQLAKRLKCRRLELKNRIWQKLNNQERWKINKYFLDQALKRGDSIRLATIPGKNIRKSSYYYKELNYLLSKNLRVSYDSLWMQPKITEDFVK